MAWLPWVAVVGLTLLAALLFWLWRRGGVSCISRALLQVFADGARRSENRAPPSEAPC